MTDAGYGFGASHRSRSWQVQKTATAVSRASRLVRCALNFFLADVRGGLGPFVDRFSVVKGRYPVRLGVIATIRRVLGPIAMTFLGARADSSHRKRLLIVLLLVILMLAGLLGSDNWAWAPSLPAR